MAGTVLDQYMEGAQIDELLANSLKKLDTEMLDLSLGAQNATLNLSIGKMQENAQVLQQLQDEKLREQLLRMREAEAIRSKHSSF